MQHFINDLLQNTHCIYLSMYFMYTTTAKQHIASVKRMMSNVVVVFKWHITV